MLFQTVHHRIKSLILILVLPLALATCLEAAPQVMQSVTLTWDACGDPSVAGYKIYFGETSHNYTTSMDVGNVTNATIAVPSANTTYYFAATAYDSEGNESDFSNETVYFVPAAPAAAATLTSVVRIDGQFGFTVSGTAGSSYVVEASTNLVDWVAVRTNTAPFTFVDGNTANFSRRFYRTMAL